MKICSPVTTLFAYSKSYEKFLGTKFDYVIVVCKEAKRKFPKSIQAKKKIYFDIPDPVDVEGSMEVRMAAFRKSRELVKKSVLRFIGKELTEESLMMA